MQAQRKGSAVLVGGDERQGRERLETALKCLGYSVITARDSDQLIDSVQGSTEEICALLLDVTSPNCDSLEALPAIRRISPDLPVIVISDDSSVLNVVTAMKNGASDFLGRPVSQADLQNAISKATASRSSVERPALISDTCSKKQRFVGNSDRMKEIQSLVGQIGWSDAPVLIQGETGTGKEVLARALHAASPRANKRLLKLNCAALPSELVESELFGYERGAFTGAFQRKAGMFEAADGGTILLDEIGDMDVRLQAKLLQVLQDKEFHRIGGKETIKVDVRVLAATHRDLEKAMIDRNFREDLYYRLNVINLQLPPLRERKEDIVPLAEHLLSRHTPAGTPRLIIPLELQHALTTYGWPGNVRELENMMRKFVVFRDAELLARELQTKKFRNPLMGSTLPVPTTGLETPLGPEPVTKGTPILEQVVRAKEMAESEAILAALNSTRWNRKHAAALLKIDYKALLYKMKKLGLEDKMVMPPAAAQEEPTEFAMAALGGR